MSGNAFNTSSQTPWRATLLTLFPDMFPGPLGASLAGKALEKNLWSLETVDIRGFATDKHNTVDDAPFGGGAGLVMRPDVVSAALESVADAPGPLLYLSPRGSVFDQDRAARLAEGPGVTLLCGRYEGVDQRVLDHHGVEEVSLGDFVLSGGELAAMTMLDAVLRLLPGVMGSSESLAEESFSDGLLEYPQYTRPAEWRGLTPPAILLSGDHAKIAAWRRETSEQLTRERRPDLWRRYAAQHVSMSGETKQPSRLSN